MMPLRAWKCFCVDACCLHFSGQMRRIWRSTEPRERMRSKWNRVAAPSSWALLWPSGCSQAGGTHAQPRLTRPPQPTHTCLSWINAFFPMPLRFCNCCVVEVNCDTDVNYLIWNAIIFHIWNFSFWGSVLPSSLAFDILVSQDGIYRFNISFSSIKSHKYSL